ncbi:MAG: type IV toxin-antitoxin system AbiEi family antitoxin domain-containing protein [Myxococcota bacterium]|nr:type IV toxin-antitoxin system AbiEi family antitoxin domain-containing protein [Myxococcota bacterium]
MPRSTKTAALLRLAKTRPVRARDLEAAGIPRTYLRRMVERGLLEQSARGVYRLADSDVTELHSLAQVAVRVPRGIICLVSALQVHGLTTEAPHAVWLMIDGKARAPTLDTPAIEIVRASGAALAHGVELRRIEGVDVRITSPAKTVADCFRYRRHVGLDVATRALREYLQPPRRPARSIDALVAAARADRITTVIRPYLEALA